MALEGVWDLDARARINNHYIKTISTTENSQIVLMSIPPGEEIGWEIHREDQVTKISQGEPAIFIEDDEWIGDRNVSILIPGGLRHNIINVGRRPLKLYTIYSPPAHPAGFAKLFK